MRELPNADVQENTVSSRFSLYSGQDRQLEKMLGQNDNVAPTLWFPLFIRCALGTTSLSSFANCFSLLDGSRLVVTHTFGSLTPACAYSSSMELLGLDVSSSSSSTWTRHMGVGPRGRVIFSRKQMERKPPHVDGEHRACNL